MFQYHKNVGMAIVICSKFSETKNQGQMYFGDNLTTLEFMCLNGKDVLKP